MLKIDCNSNFSNAVNYTCRIEFRENFDSVATSMTNTMYWQSADCIVLIKFGILQNLKSLFTNVIRILSEFKFYFILQFYGPSLIYYLYVLQLLRHKMVV